MCSTRLENLGEVNSSCREKLGELEVCKSEIGRLADVVEKRFTQVEDDTLCLEVLFVQVKEEKEEEQQLRIKAVLLEESLQEVRRIIF